jgi:hypothetical protein
MRSIPVESYPLRESYDSFEGAIAGALNDPLQPKAKADTARLLGSRIEDAWWTDTDCVIRFSTGLLLHIRADTGAVSWDLVDFPPQFDESKPERIGAPTVLLRWSNEIAGPMNRSELAAKRIGAEVEQLFVTTGTLLVYCRDQLIWWFMAVRQTETGQPILYVTEDD